MRLQKYMATCGIASRRKCEEIIAAGKVLVNDEIITEAGFKIDEQKDKVCVDGQVLETEKKYYLLFNKPENVLCTKGNSRDRKTIYDYFANIDARLFSVGRLDFKTSGLIIITNDGDFANKISHPKYECEKEYAVMISSFLTDDDIEKINSGMVIEGYKTSPAQVTLQSRTKNISVFNIVIHEGRNRQVRKITEQLGHRVLKLERIRIGNLTKNDLKNGEYRQLKADEIETLLKTKVFKNY